MKQFESRSILSELKHMKDRMDSLLSEVFTVESSPDDKKREEAQSQSWEPQTDLGETPQTWFIMADLPGVREEDLRVEILENRIIIGGKRDSFTTAGDVKFHQTERSRGTFCRSFDMPPNMKKESITAELKNGVLTITVQKDDPMPQRPFKVEVKSY